MRYTPKKLRNLLLESNYRLPKGYSVIKRKRSLSGNMALSFLSGDAGSNINSLEAKALAIYAKQQLKKAEDRLDEMEEYDELGFIGLDEIGNRQKKKEEKKEKKQEKKQQKQEKKEAKRGGGESTPTNTDPIIDDSNTEETPLAPGSRAARAVKSLVVQSRRLAAPPKDTSKTQSEVPKLLPQARRTAEKLLDRAQQQVEAAEAKVDQTQQEVALKESPTSFFAGKNLIIIGAVAVAAIAGIFFLSKKK